MQMETLQVGIITLTSLLLSMGTTVAKSRTRLSDWTELTELNCCCLVIKSSDSCDSVDYSPPGSFIRGIFRQEHLEWVAISFPSLYISNGLMGEKLCSRDLVVKAMDLKSIRVFLCRFATYWPWSFDLLDFPGGLDS